MTPLYRLDAVESPNLGRLTLWTIDRDNAEWLARFEAHPDQPPANSQLYKVDDPLGYEASVDVGAEARKVREGTLAVSAFLDGTAQRAEHDHPGCKWVQLLELERSWKGKGATLYIGDEPLDTRVTLD
jgi:hypothetical protein